MNNEKEHPKSLDEAQQWMGPYQYGLAFRDFELGFDASISAARLDVKFFKSKDLLKSLVDREGELVIKISGLVQFRSRVSDMLNWCRVEDQTEVADEYKGQTGKRPPLLVALSDLIQFKIEFPDKAKALEDSKLEDLVLQIGGLRHYEITNAVHSYENNRNRQNGPILR